MTDKKELPILTDDEIGERLTQKWNTPIPEGQTPEFVPYREIVAGIQRDADQSYYDTLYAENKKLEVENQKLNSVISQWETNNRVKKDKIKVLEAELASRPTREQVEEIFEAARYQMSHNPGANQLWGLLKKEVLALFGEEK